MATAFAPAPDPAPDSVDDEVAAFLAADAERTLLRFLTCGSVDDGKSTLIGRLLYDAKMLFQDQLQQLESDNRRFGTQGQGLDFALLVDGLSAEREQGITIDVAYRYFATERRRFIVADAPGHEQYTRNMATAASTADLAVILVDAEKGILPQTRRHSHIARLMGVRTLVLAVNKMDRVGHDQARFGAIVADYAAFAAGAGIAGFVPVPLSALSGANVQHRAPELAWHDGPTLMEALESAPGSDAGGADGPGALAVQWVNRPDQDFRGFAGTVAEGGFRVGEAVTLLPGGQSARVARIVTADGDLVQAYAGQAVTLTLDREVECARGTLIVGTGSAAAVARSLDVDLVWTGEARLETGRRYLLKTGARTVQARVASVAHVLEMNEGREAPARPLATNDIGLVRLALDEPVAVRPYRDSRSLGAFILIDRETSATVAAGMVRGVAGEERGGAAREGSIHLPVGGTADDRRAAAEALRLRLQASGTAVVLLDQPALDAQGLAAEPVAALMQGAGLAVILLVDPAPGSPLRAHGFDVADAAPDSDWVI